LYCHFYTEGEFFFKAPSEYDIKQVKKRYTPELDVHFDAIKELIENTEKSNLSEMVKTYLTDNELKMGTYLPLLRIMMCGSLKGPDLFEIMGLLGPKESKERMESALQNFKSLS